jgi:hypothetical protein
MSEIYHSEVTAMNEKIQTATKEAEDEMAERNLMGARALTQMQMHILFCIAAVLLMFLVKMPLPFSINWK